MITVFLRIEFNLMYCDLGRKLFKGENYSWKYGIFFEYNEWQFQSQFSMSRIIRNLPIPSKSNGLEEHFLLETKLQFLNHFIF